MGDSSKGDSGGDSGDGGGGYVPAAGPGLSGDYNYSSPTATAPPAAAPASSPDYSYSSPISGVDPGSFTGATSTPTVFDSGGSGISNLAGPPQFAGSVDPSVLGGIGQDGSGMAMADIVSGAAGAGQPSAFGSVAAGGDSLPSNAQFTSGVGGPASVFNVGTAPIANLIPSGTGGAAANAGPVGFAGGGDPTAWQGNSSVNGAPLSGESGVTPSATQSPTLDSLFGKSSNSGGGSSNGGSSGGGFNLLGGNPIATGIGIAGLANNIIQGQNQTFNQKQLAAAAQQQAATGQQAFNAGAPIATANASTGQQITAQGQALQQYLTTGQLPPNYQAQVDQAINSYKQQAISQAVAQGQPGDPNLNSSLAQTLASIDQQRATLTANLANTLFSAGSADISAGGALSSSSAQSLLGAGQNASGLSAQLYQTLVQNDTTQAANTGKAIATLAAALNGKSSASVGGQTITIGGS